MNEHRENLQQGVSKLNEINQRLEDYQDLRESNERYNNDNDLEYGKNEAYAELPLEEIQRLTEAAETLGAEIVDYQAKIKTGEATEDDLFNFEHKINEANSTCEEVGPA